MTIDPHDEEQIKDHGRRRRARATQEQADIQAVLELPEGQRLLRRIIEATGRDRASFIPGDTGATAYREGQRSIGIQLTDWMTDAVRKV